MILVMFSWCHRWCFSHTVCQWSSPRQPFSPSPLRPVLSATWRLLNVWVRAVVFGRVQFVSAREELSYLPCLNLCSVCVKQVSLERLSVLRSFVFLCVFVWGEVGPLLILCVRGNIYAGWHRSAHPQACTDILVDMQTCTHTQNVCAHMHACMHMHTYSQNNKSENIYNYTCTYTHSHTHTHTYMHTYMLTQMHTHARMHTHAHIHTHMHTHVCMHTHAHACVHTHTHTFW